MRPGPNPKRQRGRNQQRRHGGGGGGGGNPRNQTFESNGPEVKIRGNAHQVLERYLALARDASSQGDRVTAENYYQHAEHYYRLLAAQAQQMAQQHGGPNGGRPFVPGMGPQPDLPAVSDQPMDGDEDDDGFAEPQYHQLPPQYQQHQQPQQHHSQNPNQNQNRQAAPGPNGNGSNGSHSQNQD
jgi:hypothetical protein